MYIVPFQMTETRELDELISRFERMLQGPSSINAGEYWHFYTHIILPQLLRTREAIRNAEAKPDSANTTTSTPSEVQAKPASSPVSSWGLSEAVAVLPNEVKPAAEMPVEPLKIGQRVCMEWEVLTVMNIDQDGLYVLDDGDHRSASELFRAEPISAAPSATAGRGRTPAEPAQHHPVCNFWNGPIGGPGCTTTGEKTVPCRNKFHATAPASEPEKEGR